MSAVAIRINDCCQILALLQPNRNHFRRRWGTELAWSVVNGLDLHAQILRLLVDARDGGGAGEDSRRLGRRIQWGKGAWTVVAAMHVKIQGGCWLDALFCVPHIRHERMRFLVCEGKNFRRARLSTIRWSAYMGHPRSIKADFWARTCFTPCWRCSNPLNSLPTSKD
jgi:hypothetical protein